MVNASRENVYLLESALNVVVDGGEWHHTALKDVAPNVQTSKRHQEVSIKCVILKLELVKADAQMKFTENSVTKSAARTVY